MKIGIIIAIKRELEAFIQSGSEISEEHVSGTTIYHAKIGEHDVSAALSGYGEIDAAAVTQLLIYHTKCDIVMNFGVTGALVPGLKVKDLFVVRRVCHYEYDVSPIDPVKEHQYEEYEDEYIPLNAELIEKAKGIVPDKEGKWQEFDLVPGEYEVREGAADYTGKLCVIGSNIKEDKLAELFGL